MKYLFPTLFIASVGVLIGCAPQTTEAVTSDVEETTEEMPKAAIGEGKVIYLDDCSKCHGTKVVEDYTKEQWDKILPNMIKKAELDATQGAQVSAYVYWELEN